LGAYKREAAVFPWRYAFYPNSPRIHVFLLSLT